jgi:hypothetical protein
MITCHRMPRRGAAVWVPAFAGTTVVVTFRFKV